MKKLLTFLTLLTLSIGVTWAETVTDVLDYSFTGNPGTGYYAWSGKAGSSSAAGWAASPSASCGVAAGVSASSAGASSRRSAELSAMLWAGASPGEGRESSPLISLRASASKASYWGLSFFHRSITLFIAGMTWYVSRAVIRRCMLKILAAIPASVRFI